MKSVKKMMIGIMAAALMVTGFAGCKKDSTAEKFDGSFPQFTEPEQGEDIAVMTVKGYGTIKIRFFKIKHLLAIIQNYCLNYNDIS